MPITEASGDVNDQPTSGSFGIATLCPSAVVVLTCTDVPGTSEYGRSMTHGLPVGEAEEVEAIGASCVSMLSSVEKALALPGAGSPPAAAIWFNVAVAVASQAGARPRTKVGMPASSALAMAFSACASALAAPPPVAQPDRPSVASRMYLA